jgi:hypothetical protein
VKTLNIKALYELDGCVVEKILVEEVGLRKPCCPECGARLKRHSKRQLVIYDLPLADKNAVWITLPAIQGRCAEWECFVTQRPPEIHSTRNATWRFMRVLAVWASICPASSVATMFEINGNTVSATSSSG